MCRAPGCSKSRVPLKVQEARLKPLLFHYLHPSFPASVNDVLGAQVVHPVEQLLVVAGRWWGCAVEDCADPLQSWVQILWEKMQHSCGS